MEIKSRIALGLLALALSCSRAIALGQGQGPGQNPSPPQQWQAQGPSNGPRGRGFMRPGTGPGWPIGPGRQMERRGLGRGPMTRWFDQTGSMGIGGRGMGAQGFDHEGFLNNPAIRERLGITSDQVAKIHQQNLDFQTAQIRNRADLEVKRIELNELFAAENPDRSAIAAKLQEVSAAQMASENAAIDTRLALRDILTPAQRQQLQQLRTNRPEPSGTAPGSPRAGGRGGRGQAQPGTAPPAAPGQQAQPPANR